MFPRPDPQQIIPLLFLIQILATAMMTGIIWFVQIVHYPLFGKIPREGFTAYERSHTVRTGWVVAPLMLVELGSAVVLLFPRLFGGSGLPLSGDPLYLAALGCLILIWASTFILQVPLHCHLEQTPDIHSMDRLVSTNWIRTLLWSVRLGLLSVLAAGLSSH
jgi:hypothetical protein